MIFSFFTNVSGDITGRLSQSASFELPGKLHMEARFLLGQVGAISQNARDAVNDMNRMPTTRITAPTEHLEDYDVTIL